jgi:hypothetical protein
MACGWGIYIMRMELGKKNGKVIWDLSEERC